MHGRADMQRLLDDARSQAFDIVVADSLSRLGRDEEDRAAIRKRFTFHGIAIATPTYGVVTRLLDGISAVFDGNYLDDLKHATRRGMAGVVRLGKSAGGRAYGYRSVAGEAGALAIVEAEAVIVREIFARAAAGETPRALATDLNRRGVKPPRGKQWNASTINGNRKRGNGILANALYAGEIVWNKVAMVKDPDTGKRVSRPNQQEQWQRHAAADLAIVTAEQFAAVQATHGARSRQAPQLRRTPRRILSGLLRCGGCGGGLSIYGGKRADGAVRVRCTAHTEGGACPAPHTFRLDTIEAQALGALRAEFQHPQVLAEYVRAYHAERKRLAGSSAKRRGEIERRRAEVARAITRATAALLNGIGDAAEIDAQSKALRAEHDALGAELAALPQTQDVITLHPAVLARFAAQVAGLEAALAGPIRCGDQEAVTAIRDLVQSVTVWRGDTRGGVKIEIAGWLDQLLGRDTGPRRAWGPMVAGGRLRQSPHPAALIFRLCAA